MAGPGPEFNDNGSETLYKSVQEMWVELYNDVRLQYWACWGGGGPHLAWVGGGAPCPGAGPCCAAPAQRSSCAAQQTGGRRAFHRWPLTKVGRRFIICRGKRHIVLLFTKQLYLKEKNSFKMLHTGKGT